jgi:hypothetical protein
MKARSATRKPRTYFEQIPVKVVKKIVLARDRKKETTGTANVIVEPPARKTEPYSMPLSSLCWAGH